MTDTDNKSGGKENSIIKTIIITSLPAVVQMFLKMSIGVVDRIMVGQLGESVIAGVGVSEQLIFFLLMLFSSISSGVNSLASQCVGAKKFERLRPIFGSAFITAIAAALFFNAVFYIYPAELLKLLGANEAIASAGMAYLKITSFSVVSITLTFMMTAIFRAFADNKTPMYSSLAAIVINTTLAFIFIFILKLGVAGAAFAALIGRFSELIIMAVIFERKKKILMVSLKDAFRFSRTMFYEIVKIGWPVSIDMFVWQLAGVVSTYIILKLGTAAAGANEVVKMVQGIALMPVVGVATAATALVGHDLGRGDFDGAGKKSEAISRVSLYFIICVSVIIALLSGKIPGLFNFSAEGKSLAANSILLLTAFQIFNVYNICYPYILRAGGDTRVIIYISGSAMWLCGLPLAYFFGVILKYGLCGVVLGNGIGEAIKALMFRRRYARGVWRKKLV